MIQRNPLRSSDSIFSETLYTKLDRLCAVDGTDSRNETLDTVRERDVNDFGSVPQRIHEKAFHLLPMSPSLPDLVLWQRPWRTPCTASKHGPETYSATERQARTRGVLPPGTGYIAPQSASRPKPTMTRPAS